MKLKRVFLILSALLIAVSVTSCGKNAENEASVQQGELPKKLTIFAPMGAQLSKVGTSNNDILSFQLMEKLTGCKVEWIQPNNEAFNEKFNLMVVSGDLPDVIVGYWSSVSGSASSYAENKIIVPMTDLVKEYMPNLSAFNEERPEIKKQYTDDRGNIFYIPFIRKDAKLKVFLGPQIREDWVKKLGLSMPETTDELYGVLKAFKTRNPNGNGTDIIPMSGVGFANNSHGIGNLLWAFGTHYNFYVDEGTVRYGIMEDRFEAGLTYILKLFNEGLIDVDFVLQDREKLDAKVLNNRVGFIYSFQPTKFANSVRDLNTDFKVSAIKHLRGPYGENKWYASSYFNDINSVSAAITTANKNPEGTAKWLDCFFDEKGVEYMNFGEEGKTFHWENGYPKLTDYLLNNPNGTDRSSMLAKSISAFESTFPTIQDWRYYEQYIDPAGLEAIDIWASDVDISGILPPITFTEEEQKTVTKAMSQIKTYFDEMMNKIILGEETIEKLPKIRNTINEMGMPEVLRIYQNAYDRYQKR